jgi:hypothetical protein
LTLLPVFGSALCCDWAFNFQFVLGPIADLFFLVVKELADRLFIFGRSGDFEERSCGG